MSVLKVNLKYSKNLYWGPVEENIGTCRDVSERVDKYTSTRAHADYSQLSHTKDLSLTTKILFQKK